MFQAALILMISAGLVLFYLQKALEGILRREFDRPYFKAIVNAYCLEFSNVQKALNESDAPVDYNQLRVALKCDFMTLARLLKMSPRVGFRYSKEDRLLVVYSRIGFLSLAVRHLLRLRERPAILKLAATLQYLANLVGQRELQFALSHPPAPFRRS
jgi:hypothetical protein